MVNKCEKDGKKIVSVCAYVWLFYLFIILFILGINIHVH
jgi:hypothetical protein